MRHFLITIVSCGATTHLDVLAKSAVDAILSVMDRLPFEAKVTVTPV